MVSGTALATLMVRDPQRANRPVVIGGPVELDTDSGTSLLVFPIESLRVAALLQGQDTSRLQLKISYSYRAKLVNENLVVTGKFLSDSLRSAKQKLFSKGASGQLPTLAVPIGGVATLSKYVAMNAKSQLFLTILKREGQASDDFGNVAQGYFDSAVREFLKNSLQEIDRTTLADDTFVRMVMSDGLTVSMAMNKIETFRDYFKSDRERKTKQLFEKLVTQDNYDKWDAGISATIPVFEIPVDFGLNGGQESSSSRTDKITQLSENFQKDLLEIDKTFSGEVKFLSAMDVAQANSIISNTNTSLDLNFGSFQYGEVSDAVRILLDEIILRAR